MLRKVSRLFVIKNRFEAYAIIYALALGAANRGSHYLDDYPGWMGWTLFVACLLAVLMAGAKIIDSLKLERELREARAALEKAAAPAPVAAAGPEYRKAA